MTHIFGSLLSPRKFRRFWWIEIDGRRRLPAAPVAREAVERFLRKRASAEEEQACRKALVKAQARADDVCHAWGEQAPPPMTGETPLAYRRRLLERHQRLCPEFKDVDLDSITDPKVFDGIESRIYEASVAESEKGFVLPDILRERKKRDDSGRLISTFYGSPSTWMQQFSNQPRRVLRINTDKVRPF